MEGDRIRDPRHPGVETEPRCRLGQLSSYSTAEAARGRDAFTEGPNPGGCPQHGYVLPTGPEGPGKDRPRGAG